MCYFFVRVSVKLRGCSKTGMLLQLNSCFVDVSVLNVCLDFVGNEINIVFEIKRPIFFASNAHVKRS